MDFNNARKRIIARVNISNDGCWNYALAIRKNGYARITYKRKSWYAHRLSYVAFNEFIIMDKNLDVCHSCDNRKCINPAHLFLGTRKENMQDAVEKGRQAKGFSLPQTKLSKDDVNKIILLAKKGFLYKEIAEVFNVTRAAINKITINNGIRRC